MDKKNKITIPEPCHENWDKMTPKDNGRFCLSCTKTVVDFTKMLPEEIKHYFISNQDQSICGRFKNTQLDEVIIQIPEQVLYSQIHYHKMFLLALFIAMGTTLFSCGEKGGNKKKINKVEVVKDSLTEPIFVGEIPIDTSHYGNNPPPPPPKVDHVKFLKPHENVKQIKHKKKSKKSVALYTSSPLVCKKSTPKINNIKENDQFITGMVMGANPDFPGGIEKFYTFFGNEFKTPENSSILKRKIRITFSVEIDGSLTYVETIPSVDNDFKDEIIRVLKLSPQWKAGESNGKKIRTNYSLPISIQ